MDGGRARARGPLGQAGAGRARGAATYEAALAWARRCGARRGRAGGGRGAGAAHLAGRQSRLALAVDAESRVSIATGDVGIKARLEQQAQVLAQCAMRSLMMPLAHLHEVSQPGTSTILLRLLVKDLGDVAHATLKGKAGLL